MSAGAAALIVVPRRLTAEAFSPYGEVIEVGATGGVSANAGTARRFDDVAALDLGRDGGRPMLSLFRAEPLGLPLRLTLLERHPLSSQAFLPLSPRPFLVAVARPGEPPTATEVAVFLTAPFQGVNYAPGVWHHPLVALGAVSDFAVIGRQGPDENCDIVPLDRPILVDPIDLGPAA